MLPFISNMFNHFDAEIKRLSKLPTPSHDYTVQTAEEEEYIESVINYELPNQSITSVNPDSLVKVARENFNNIYLMEEMASIVMASHWPAKYLTSTQLVHSHIKPQRMIGGGGYGIVFTAGFMHPNELLAIKINSEEDVATDIHEIAIGFKLNTLRTRTPNYAYVYGFYSCHREKDNIASFCVREGTKQKFIVYENIPGTTLNGRLQRGMNPCEFFSAYIQIMHALRIANDAFEYSHYDLHTKNVIIRPTTAKYVMERRSDSNTYIETFGGIATMIDFGMSYLKHHGGSRHLPLTRSCRSFESIKNTNVLGSGSDWAVPINFPPYAGIESNANNLFYDAFKLLFTSYTSAANLETQKHIVKAMRFFHFTLADITKLAESDHYPHLPRKFSRGLSFDRWIVTLEKIFKTLGGTVTLDIQTDCLACNYKETYEQDIKPLVGLSPTSRPDPSSSLGLLDDSIYQDILDVVSSDKNYTRTVSRFLRAKATLQDISDLPDITVEGNTVKDTVSYARLIGAIGNLHVYVQKCLSSGVLIPEIEKQHIGIIREMLKHVTMTGLPKIELPNV